MSEIFDLVRIGHYLIVIGLGTGIVVDGKKYLLAEMIHCFSIGESFC
jgi:hypothetical protein